MNLFTLLVFLGTMALALLAQMYVKSMFRRYSRVEGSSGFSGAEAAAEILRRNGIQDVRIFEHQGFLGDHYDPLHKRLVLSSDVYHGRSLSALGLPRTKRGMRSSIRMRTFLCTFGWRRWEPPISPARW